MVGRWVRVERRWLFGWKSIGNCIFLPSELYLDARRALMDNPRMWSVTFFHRQSNGKIAEFRMRR